MHKDYLYYCRDLRSELLKIDNSLEVGDTFSIKIRNNEIRTHGAHERSYYQVLYTLSNTLRNFTQAVDGNILTLRKQFIDRTYGSNNTFALLIVTAGSNQKNIDAILELTSQITDIKLNVYVCGPAAMRKVYGDKVIYLLDDDLNLSEKKKRLIDASTEETIILVHDHVALHKNFFNKLNDYRFWDVYSCPRYANDTGQVPKPSHGSFINYSGCVEGISWRPKNQKFKGNINYEKIFINGGFICVRRSILKCIKWPNHLGWGAMEDIHLSRDLTLNGAVFYYDKNNWFYASSKRLGHQKKFLHKISFIKILIYLPNIIKNYLRYGKITFND